MFDADLVSDDILEIRYEFGENFVLPDPKTNVVIAAFTTAYARLQLYEELDRLGERVLYYDTDSVIYLTQPGEPEPQLGNYIGDLIDEEYIIQNKLKPKLLNVIDPNQFGFIARSSTKFALISMLHKWLAATDGTSSAVRVILLDFKKAFDLVDHNILVAKLYSYGIKPTVLNWIVDFLRNRYQRVKIDSNCFSDFLHVPAGVPQGTKLGSWLFLAMINDLKFSNDPLEDMWKYADDSTISEVVPMSNNSALQLIVDEAVGWSDLNVKNLEFNFLNANHYKWTTTRNCQISKNFGCDLIR